MSEFNITVDGGTSVRLPTAGKYVDRDIIVTATGSGGATEPDSTSEYQRVEYITSAEEGTYPYIITDFVADNTCGLEVIASFPILQDQIPMGSRLDSGTTRFYCVYPLSASTCYYGFNGGFSVSCSTSINTIYRLQTNFLNSRLVNIYDENGNRKASTSISSSLTQQTCPVAIFGYNYASSEAVTSKREYKLYGARCSRGNEVVREYIPCYRKSDGVVGLYEKFTGEFLTDENGILFDKGANIEWGYISDGIIPEGTLEITENGIYDVTEYATANVNVPTGGGGDGADVARSIVDKSITAFSDSEITTIGGYSFVDCEKMTSVNIPKATSLGNYAFSSSGALNSVNIPAVTSIGQYAFNACVGLSTIKGEAVTSLGNYAFTGCSALTSVDFPNLTTLGTYVFQNCTLLPSFNGENVTTVGTYAFTGCSALIEISLPKATSIAGYAFNACGASHISLPSLKSMTSGAFRGSRFVSVDLPNVTNIGNNAFRAQAYIQRLVLPKVASTASESVRNCDALTYVDLPVCTSFGSYTFNDCNNLETLILRTTSKVCTMGNVNVLQLTKIANGEGYIYVPASMVDSYKVASNWSTYANQIRAIEDYPEITGG